MVDHVYPEDTGTGATDGDYADAANLAQLVHSMGFSDTVVSGMNFSNISGTSVDIGSGVAVVSDTSATAKNTSESRTGVSYVVEADARTGLTLTDNSINYIFLKIDLTSDDTITYHIDTDNTPPTDPYLNIGTVDTNDNTATELNRDYQVVQAQDSGTDVEMAGVLNFGSDLSVSGDGDGTATIDASAGTDVITSPNLHFSFSELADTASIRTPVVMFDGTTLEVQAWGVVDTDGNTPAGLTVALVDPSGTDVLRQNTSWNTDSTGITSYSNTSGGIEVPVLEIANDTGTSYTDPNGVGGRVGYEVN